jgi:hypothetical protein
VLLTWLPAHDRDPDVIYAVDEKFSILRCNRAWDAFALDNNGSLARASKVQGVCLFDVIPRDLSKFYDSGFASARQVGRWQHVFDCSSARVLRQFRMTVTLSGSGFLIRNVLIKDTLAPPSEANGKFTDYGTAIDMCSHCRRVENKKLKSWQWVPEFIDRTPPEIRNTLCPACYSYHYGEKRESASGAHSAA